MTVHPDVGLLKTAVVCTALVFITLILSIGGCSAHKSKLNHLEREELLKKIKSVEIDPCEQCLRRTFSNMKVKLKKLGKDETE